VAARRGLLPHNRFTDRFNTYVLSIAELEAYFKTRSEETFIDEAEVRRASRGTALGDYRVRQQQAACAL